MTAEPASPHCGDSIAPRTTPTRPALQWIRSGTPARRPTVIDPDSILVPRVPADPSRGCRRTRVDGSDGRSGGARQDDRSAVAAAGAPDAGAGERRRAGEEEA